MTILSGDAKVRRETMVQYRRRPLIVEIGAHEVTIREKARRRRWSVPILAVYELAMKLQFREQQKAREAERKAKGLKPRKVRFK